MAIAYDSGTNPTYVNAATHTFAHTTSGSDRLLWVHCWRRSGSANTGVTYNGVSMTSLGAEILAQTVSGDAYLTLWYLAAPATGTNNVVVTSASGLTEHIDSASSYTGCSQTGIPDAQATLSNTTQSDTTGTVTTVADNSWAILFLRTQSGNSTAGSGTTIRTDAAGFTQTFDGNSPKTPAGSYSLNTTHVSGQTGYWMASFAPPGASSSVKTAEGLAIASVKTGEGLAIASIKNWVGLA